MEFVILAAIVALVVYWVRKRRQRAKESLELTLAVVGFEASGKTVFAASMYNELRVPDASGVFLDTTPENAGKLLALYNITADTDKKFPNSTNKGELIEWPFTVKVRSAASITDIGKFCYLDFAGESLRDLYTTAPNPETMKLHARFTNADVLMAALDGLQVKRFMEGRPRPGFHQDLGTLLAVMSNQPKVANLILTKWDILEDSFTFRQVVERLFQITQFANFVRAQQTLGTCRLIPVSSVGPGFACEDGNAIRKVPGKVINPVRVEVPMACTLPDALTGQQRKAAPAGRSRLMGWARGVKLNLGMIEFDFGSFGSPPPVLTPAPNTPAAIGQLVRYCVSKVSRLEADFPESDLLRFMYQNGL